jgi:hypothetical protein
LALEDEAFGIPSIIDTQIARQLSEGAAKDVKIVQLRSMDVTERDFYSEHTYAAVLAGDREGVMATVLAADRGPLMISWTGARFVEGKHTEKTLQLTFTVYSVSGDRDPAEVAACRPLRDSAVWLPWLQRPLHQLSTRRESLCSQGTATPLRTAGIVRLLSIEADKGADGIIKEALHKRRRSAASLVEAAGTLGRPEHSTARPIATVRAKAPPMLAQVV